MIRSFVLLFAILASVCGVAVGQGDTTSTKPQGIKTVYIGTPMYDGKLYSKYYQSVLESLDYFMIRQKRTDIRLNFGAVELMAEISAARSSIMKFFLKNPEHTHLLMIDNDIKFSPQLIERLIDSGKPVLAAAAPIKVPPNWSLLDRILQNNAETMQGDLLDEILESAGYEMNVDFLPDTSKPRNSQGLYPADLKLDAQVGQRVLRSVCSTDRGRFLYVYACHNTFSHSTCALFFFLSLSLFGGHSAQNHLKVKAVGMGFVMFTREAVQRMWDHYRDELEFTHSQFGKVVGLFQNRVFQEDGQPPRAAASEYHAFWERYRRLGGEVWLDVDQGVSHQMRITYHGEDFFESFRPGTPYRETQVIFKPWSKEYTTEELEELLATDEEERKLQGRSRHAEL